MSTRTSSRPAAPRRRKHIALFVTIAVVVALVAVAVGGEFYARHRVSSCMADSLQQDLGSDVDVSFGATPLLASVFTHSVSSVDIDSDDVDLAGPGQTSMRGLTLRSTIHDIDLPQGGDSAAAGSVGSSEATVTWDSVDMLSSLQTLPFGRLITGVHTDSADGTIAVEVLGGVGTLTLEPRISDGRVSMHAKDVSALGIGLPTSGAQDIIDMLTANLADYPLRMQPRSVDVTDDGLRVKLRGASAPLQPAGDQGGGCSLI